MRALLFILLFSLNKTAGAQTLLSKTPVQLNTKYKDSVNFYSITYLSDGLKIKGFLVEPKYGGKHPVIICNRGGNQDIGMLDNNDLLFWFAPLAKNGYIVITSQYRGSPGSQGNDEMGGRDVNDVLNLVPVIHKLPNADTNRIGMYGWSRGGIMTYRALAKTSKIKTAVIGASPTDLARETKRRPEMDSICAALIPSYKTNRKLEIQKRSAIYWPEKINSATSLLILHGTGDWRVHYSESVRMSEKLKALKHPHTLKLFKGDDHGLHKHQKEKDSLILAWFKEHL